MVTVAEDHCLSLTATVHREARWSKQQAACLENTTKTKMTKMTKMTKTKMTKRSSVEKSAVHVKRALTTCAWMCALGATALACEPAVNTSSQSGDAVVDREFTDMDTTDFGALIEGSVVVVHDIDGYPLELVVTRVKRSGAVLVYQASVVGHPNGLAIVSFNRESGAVRANIDLGTRMFAIHNESGSLVVEDLDRKLYFEPGCMGPAITPSHIGATRAAISRRDATDPNYIFRLHTEEPEETGDVIDVMVLYTDDLANRPGFTEGALRLRTETTLAAVEAAYLNSGVDATRFNLVQVEETDYSEVTTAGGCGTMNSAMGNNTVTGVDIPELRFENRADIVMLAATRCVASDGTNRVGQAANVNQPGDFTTIANSVLTIDYDSMTGLGLSTVAHELGHILGAAHNPEQSQGAGYHSDSRGYCSVSGASVPGAATEEFMTIMSYNCQGISGGAAADLPIIANFSSDTINVNRPDATGTLQNMATGNGNQDNARALADTRKLTANWTRRSYNLYNENVGLLMTAVD